MSIFYTNIAILSRGKLRKKAAFPLFSKISLLFTKTIIENIYKTPMKKLKKSIDFYQKMWYYLIKERENPRSSREVGTGSPPKFTERSSVQWKAKFEAEGEGLVESSPIL